MSTRHSLLLLPIPEPSVFFTLKCLGDLLQACVSLMVMSNDPPIQRRIFVLRNSVDGRNTLSRMSTYRIDLTQENIGGQVPRVDVLGN